MVGAIIGYTVLALLAIIIVLLVLPATLSIEYCNKKLLIKVRILFLKFKISPQKELTEEEQNKKQEKKAKKEALKKQKQEKKNSKKAKKEQSEKKEPEESEEKPKKKKSISDWILLGQELLGSSGKAAKFIFRHLHISGVELEFPIYDEDMAKLAINYGRTQGVISTAYATLQNVTKIRYKKIHVIADFGNQYNGEITFACKIGASPIIMVIAAIIGLKKYLAYKKQKKENYRITAKQMVRQQRATAIKQKQQAKATNENNWRQEREE